MSYEMEKPSVSDPSEALARLATMRVAATPPAIGAAMPQTDAALKRLDMAMDLLNDYIGAIGEAADFLCGPIPESLGANANASPAPGIVGRIDDRTARLGALLDALQSHAERLGAL